MEKFKGLFFYVKCDNDYCLVESFTEALSIYYIQKKYSTNIMIVDAITDKIIFR